MIVSTMTITTAWEWEGKWEYVRGRAGGRLTGGNVTQAGIPCVRVNKIILFLLTFSGERIPCWFS